MKNAIWLLVGVFGSAILVFAQNAQDDKPEKMMGTICNSACVVQQANTPTCDPTCTDKSGSTVLVSDSGKVQQIANQQMPIPHMGKQVETMAVPTEKEREESLRVLQLNEQAP